MDTMTILAVANIVLAGIMSNVAINGYKKANK